MINPNVVVCQCDRYSEICDVLRLNKFNGIVVCTWKIISMVRQIINIWEIFFIYLNNNMIMKHKLEYWPPISGALKKNKLPPILSYSNIVKIIVNCQRVDFGEKNVLHQKIPLAVIKNCLFRMWFKSIYKHSKYIICMYVFRTYRKK